MIRIRLFFLPLVCALLALVGSFAHAAGEPLPPDQAFRV